MKFVAFDTFGVLIDSLHIADVQFDTDFRPWLIQILTASDENVLRQISDYLKEKLNLKFHFNLNFFFGNFYSKNHNLAFIYVYNLKKFGISSKILCTSFLSAFVAFSLEITNSDKENCSNRINKNLANKVIS